MNILGINISRNKVAELAETKTTETSKTRRKLSEKLLQKQKPDIEVEMEKFLQTVRAAKDIERPDRKLLYAFYEKIIERDSHLRSQLRTAHFTVQQSDFQILKDSKENKDLKAFFETSWFTDFITYAIDQEFWGHSLVECKHTVMSVLHS